MCCPNLVPNRYLAKRVYDIVQPDIMHCGGITEMQRIAAMANTCGIQVNPHVWGSPVMVAASLHLAATVPPCPPARTPLTLTDPGPLRRVSGRAVAASGYRV